MLPKSRLATLWDSDGAAPWSLSTTSSCLSMIQVTGLARIVEGREVQGKG